VLFAAAILVREAAWTLPFALVLGEAARGRPAREAWHAARGHFALLAVGVACVLALPAYRALLERSFDVRGPLTNLAAQVDGIGYLVSQPLLTLRLSIDPDVAIGPIGMRWLLEASALLALVALGFALLRRRPLPGFAILWFLLQLLPTNSLIARLDLANDRQLYLALIGPALLAAAALDAVRSRRVALLCAAALVVVLAVVTVVRNRDYASEVSLWQATAHTSPGKARVWNNLGYALQLTGDRDGAASAYRRALALDPGEYKARVNLELLEAR
jgi:protein O-mannosyl-transferase